MGVGNQIIAILEKYQILFLFLLVAMLRGTTLYLSVIDWDETAYVLVAREILNGHWPYSAAFDHKPIAIYLHFAALLSVFGDTPTASRLLSFFMVFGSSLLLNHILQKQIQVSFITRMVFVTGYVIACTGLSGLASNTEHVLNFYTLAWMWAILKAQEGQKSYYALAGTLMAISFHSNYLTGFIVFAFGIGFLLYLLLTRETFKAALAECLTGGALAFLTFMATSILLLLPIYLFGDLHEYFELQKSFILGYFPNPGSAGRLLVVLELFSPFLLILFILSGLLLGQLLMQRKAGSLQPQTMQSFALALMFLLLLFGATYAAGGSRRYYPHYFILLLPSFALLFSVSLKTLDFKAWRLRLALTAIFLSFVFIGSTGTKTYIDGLRQYKRIYFNQSNKMDTPRLVADKVAPILEENEEVYVLCAQPVIYQLLERSPLTKFGFFLHHFHSKYTDAFSTTVEAEVTKVLDQDPGIVILGDFPLCKRDALEKDWLMVKEELRQKGYQQVMWIKGHNIYKR